ncbi:uncharacterized protein LOC115881836 isoform X1 [Sitophilus oryzae]|uniref:Uncharacterized protein LOC115881836 isoform X1 n=1 Tax=Sitophilus oryzae TaxID=7048 RepID=A0A6J2XV21_SITOR|nr:uncharacterized protein LOC115881836 isoform X1 [Sitophilus oryzae]
MVIFYNVIFLLIFLLETSISEDDRTLWKARRELARRTREYLRTNPMSDDLRQFIQEARRSRRKKRQGHNNMYAVKNGEVVPLNEIEQDISNRDTVLGENFTVVPLIIPIPLENNVTLKDRDDNRNNNEETTHRGRFGDGDQISEKEETVVDSVIKNKLKSTSESTALSKVLEDVESLINSQRKQKSANDGALCSVYGFWDSKAAGVSFHIRKSDDQDTIIMKKTEPATEEGFMQRTRWNVTILIPFEQKAQVIISGVCQKNHRIVAFLGECRVCEGSEAIVGDWMVGRPSSGCKDQKASHAFFADVIRKNNIETLREEHLNKCTTDMNLPSTDIDSD